MDFELTNEQREIQALAHDFAQAEIEPHAADWDREHRFPRELYAKLAELGLNSSSTVDLVVEGAAVGRDRLLGEEKRGFAVAMSTLDGGRIGIAAQAVGITQAAFDVARGYALERRQFGNRIADFQAIQHKLANMSMELDAARLLVYRAAWL